MSHRHPRAVSISVSQPTFPWKVLPRWKVGIFKSPAWEGGKSFLFLPLALWRLFIDCDLRALLPWQ